MQIIASANQISNMMKLAVMASKPVGIGFLHYNSNLKIEDIKGLEINQWGAYVDYYEGRMVKFSARFKGNDTWEFDDRISADYQSWCWKYNSYKELFDAACKVE